MTRVAGTSRIGVAASLLLAALFLSTAAALAAGQPRAGAYQGLRLAEALQVLQANGVRLVFSSEIVTADMRVETEPRATTDRGALLDELLEPHDLEAVRGPGGVIQVLRSKQVKPRAPRPSVERTTGAIWGQVTDGTTGSPLRDVLVQLIGTPLSTRTDEAGRFHLTDLQAGAHTLRMLQDEYRPETGAVEIIAGKTTAVTVTLSPRAVTYTERLTVTPAGSDRTRLGGGPVSSLSRRQLDERRGALTDDPLRVIHAMPRVAATDDLKAEFSVRGSPYRHLGVIVDGVATPWLRHTAHGRGEIGSLAMLGSDVLEDATLRAGAYPQRHGNILGAEIDLTLREGSRDGTRLQGALSGTNVAMIAEGPIGTSRRGSWLVSARKSHLTWPVRPGGESSGTVFSFSDGLAKLVYDASPTQQATVTVMGGRSLIEEGDDRAPHELGDGVNQAMVLNVGWRSTLGKGLVLKQQAYLVDHQFYNQTHAEQPAGHGTDRQVSYRADLLRHTAGGALEAGAQLQRVHATRVSAPNIAPSSGRLNRSLPVDGATPHWLRSGYVHYTWTPTSQLTIAPGFRVTDSTLVRQRVVSPWVLGTWSLPSGWTLNAGAGVTHQFPDFVQAGQGFVRLLPESATHVDLGVERQVGRSLVWQATVFAREEHNVLWAPNARARLVDGLLVEPTDTSRLENTLSGSARGVELLLESRRPIGLSGWIAYSFGKARYTDAVRGESFWADFDQRHAITLSGVYRFSNRTILGIDFRGGSNFPIPGPFAARDRALFVANGRNEIRLPAYLRLDVRASRSFTYAGRRLHLFVEVLNVLNRTNLGVGDGIVRSDTGEAVGFSRTLLPRQPAVGLIIEF